MVYSLWFMVYGFALNQRSTAEGKVKGQ